MSLKVQKLKELTTNTVDPNIIHKKRSKIELQAKIMKGVSLPKMKDRDGNNIKQHLGIWKYFIDTQTMERDKHYICMDATILKGPAAVKRA